LKQFSLKVAVTLSGAVLMALEILGSRVLAPSFGSSVYVWGSLISTFLLALALGYALGGVLADRLPDEAVLASIFALAAVLLLPVILLGPPVLEGLRRSGLDVRWASLSSALLFFLPSSLAMGMISPYAIRLSARGVESVGRTAGVFSALSTGGSIAGTLLATFVLIPRYPVPTLLAGLAVILFVCAFLMARTRRAAGVVSATALLWGITFALQRPASNPGGEQVRLVRDTAYHHIRVSDFEGVRYLRFDNLTQGAILLSDPERNMLGYASNLMFSFAIRPDIRRVAVIGLGAGILPRQIARLVPGSTVDSVEIDPAVRDVARDFFFFRETTRTRTTVEDGRVFLSSPGDSYDLIVLDAFNSSGTPFHLLTREFFETVRRRLSPDGVFAANFIGRLMGKDDRLFWAAYRTIRAQFGQVYLASPELAAGKRSFEGNLILFATLSADPLTADQLRRGRNLLASRWSERERPPDLRLLHSPDPPDGTPELTDAYAPVEALQSFEARTK
jgi:spermidine synthase